MFFQLHLEKYTVFFQSRRYCTIDNQPARRPTEPYIAGGGLHEPGRAPGDGALTHRVALPGAVAQDRGRPEQHLEAQAVRALSPHKPTQVHKSPRLCWWCVIFIYFLVR